MPTARAATILVLLTAGCLPSSRVDAQIAAPQAELVLEAHNDWRARHQAPPLAWSADLARYAQAWAETLVTSYPGRLLHSQDGARGRPEAQALGYGGWGENLHWSSALIWSDGRREPRRDLTAREVVDAWAGEVQWYDFETTRCAPEADPGCGHFTQVVWLSTQRVGCGRAFGADGSQVWACSYDPPGNYDGEYRTNVLPPPR